MTEPRFTIYANPKQSNIRCFKNDMAANCRCNRAERFVQLADVMAQVERGGFDCPKCGARGDLHNVSHFPVFGAMEGVFGLLRLTLSKEIPATSVMQVIQVDVPEIPGDWRIIYCNFTPGARDTYGGFEEMPRPLGPQEMHQYWGLPLSVCVPAGGKRVISITFICRDNRPVPLAIDLGLQGCELMARYSYGTACVLAAASVEASLRAALEPAYKARGVAMPSNAGFGQLLGLARMMLDPPLGSSIVGSLQALAKEGRNPVAHGAEATELTQTQVAHWLVDAALVYEWATHATIVGAPGV